MTPAPKPRAKRKPRKFSSIKPPTLAQVRAYQAKTRTTIKKKKRPAGETRRIYGPELFRTFLHNHECLGCGRRIAREHIQQAHVKTGGMSRKDDWTRTGPLCGPRIGIVFKGNWPQRTVAIDGCHAAQGAAKKSWRTHDGLTFADGQKRFFAEWECHAVMVRKLKGCDE